MHDRCASEKKKRNRKEKEKEKKEKKEKRKDAERRQFDEKPSTIPGCPGCASEMETFRNCLQLFAAVHAGANKNDMHEVDRQTAAQTDMTGNLLHRGQPSAGQ